MADTYKALATVAVGAGGAGSITFSNIPQTYTDLIVKVSGRSSANGGIARQTMYVSINGVTTNSKWVWAIGFDSNATNPQSGTSNIFGWSTDAGATANIFSNVEFSIANYANAHLNKVLHIDNAIENNSTTRWVAGLVTGVRELTTPVTSLVLSNENGNFVEHSTATLYGVFNADVSSAPATPTIGTATAGNASASITFTGVSNAASYTMTSTPGSLTGTGTTSPITVSGLTNNTAYTFKVKSNNPFGSSAESAASNSVTPSAGVYESIATATGNGSATFLEFTNIPSTFTHLQLRLIGQPNNSAGGGTTSIVMRVNTDGTNVYTEHWARGTLSTASSGNGINQSYWNVGFSPQGSGSTGGFTDVYSGFVIDILDYANTNKFKTMRSIGGYNRGNSGFVSITSGLWRSTSAITNLRVYINDGLSMAWNTNSRVALYGIKTA